MPMRAGVLRVALLGAGVLVGLALLGNLALVMWVLADALLTEVALAVSLVFALGGYLLLLLLAALGVFRKGAREFRATAGPPVQLLLGMLVVVLLGGELALSAEAPAWAAVAFILGAALPPLIALVVTLRRLQTAVSQRLLLSGVLVGSFVSTNVALALEVALPGVLAALVLPLRDLLSDLLRARSIEELYFSRGLIVALIEAALVAPLAEEAAKPLGVLILMRWIGGRREAFLVGMAGGLGFAVLENMFYEGIWFGDDWLAVTAVRAIGGALHPLGAGLVGLALYDLRRSRSGAWGRLGGAFALAAAIHMAWNGGLVMLYSTLAERVAVGQGEIDVLDVDTPAVVLAWLAGVSALTWRLLFLVTARLRDEDEAGIRPLATLGLEQPRRLALASTAALIAALLVGELWGPVLVRQLTLTFG